LLVRDLEKRKKNVTRVFGMAKPKGAIKKIPRFWRRHSLTIAPKLYGVSQVTIS
jgi:hypothetical protein